MLDILKERMARMRDSAEGVAAGMIRNKVPEHIQETRYAICKECPHLYQPTDTCKKCGCFMKVKTWMPGQVCPINKWGMYVTESEK